MSNSSKLRILSRTDSEKRIIAYTANNVTTNATKAEMADKANTIFKSL